MAQVCPVCHRCVLFGTGVSCLAQVCPVCIWRFCRHAHFLQKSIQWSSLSLKHAHTSFIVSVQLLLNSCQAYIWYLVWIVEQYVNGVCERWRVTACGQHPDLQQTSCSPRSLLAMGLSIVRPSRLLNRTHSEETLSAASCKETGGDAEARPGGGTEAVRGLFSLWHNWLNNRLSDQPR